MKKYLITYDLKNESKDYSFLYQAIKDISGYWWHYLDSTWIVKCPDLTVKQIFERLRPHIDTEGKDRILIVEIKDENRQGWLPRKAWNWLKRDK